MVGYTLVDTRGTAMKLRTMAMMGVGAAAAYYLDPDLGARRRQALGEMVPKRRSAEGGEGDQDRSSFAPGSEVRGETELIVITAAPD